mmetsp:Transcript_42919/g.110792  ORF Transcript_42919/g.110792 Transcript_42919/m.110792 type:complete len:401 (+) Transcript_42919:1414-2616(+)
MTSAPTSSHLAFSPLFRRLGCRSGVQAFVISAALLWRLRIQQALEGQGPVHHKVNHCAGAPLLVRHGHGSLELFYNRRGEGGRVGSVCTSGHIVHCHAHDRHPHAKGHLPRGVFQTLSDGSSVCCARAERQVYTLSTPVKCTVVCKVVIGNASAFMPALWCAVQPFFFPPPFSFPLLTSFFPLSSPSSPLLTVIGVKHGWKPRPVCTNVALCTHAPTPTCIVATYTNLVTSTIVSPSAYAVELPSYRLHFLPFRSHLAQLGFDFIHLSSHIVQLSLRRFQRSLPVFEQLFHRCNARILRFHLCLVFSFHLSPLHICYIMPTLPRQCLVYYCCEGLQLKKPLEGVALTTGTILRRSFQVPIQRNHAVSDGSERLLLLFHPFFPALPLHRRAFHKGPFALTR